MGIFSSLIGNVSETKPAGVEKSLAAVLMPEEEVDLAFRLVRDLVVFTDYRLIIVDKQGMTGKKTEYKTYPFKSICHFSVETSGHFDLDGELRIWLIGREDPVEVLQFGKDKNIIQIQKALAMAIL